MTSQMMMKDVLANEVVVITSWQDQEMYAKQGFTLYDPVKKVVLGKVSNFLADIDADENDIRQAFDSTIDFFGGTFLTVGLELISTEREKKNGTIVLKQLNTERNFRRVGGGSSYYIYKIYANGQIRQELVNRRSSFCFDRVHYRLASPEPTMRHGKSFFSLATTYDNAVWEVLAKYNSKKELAAKKLEKEAATQEKFNAQFMK
jgi:hypothetical protein